MSGADRDRWDARYLERQDDRERTVPTCPPGFGAFEERLPTRGAALDIACGAGDGALWLAERGLDVIGVDVSPVAVDLATAAATGRGLGDRVRFECSDLDDGLPVGPAVDLVTCHLFSAPDLDAQVIGRLAEGGMLAITVLSEVGAEPGLFRAGPGELLERFAGLEILHHEEGDGRASLLAIVTGPDSPGRLD